MTGTILAVDVTAAPDLNVSEPRESESAALDIVVHDDHVMLAAGLADVLARDGMDVLAATHDRASLVALVAALAPRVCLVGVSLVDDPLLEVVSDLHRVSADTSVVVVVGTSTPQLWHLWDSDEVTAVVGKRCRLGQVVEAVRLAHAGQRSAVGLRRPPADRVATPRWHLTDREAEVLRLVAAGASTREIADELTISVNTVRTHVQHLLDKAGVRNRVQLALLAHEHGLARPE